MEAFLTEEKKANEPSQPQVADSLQTLEKKLIALIDAKQKGMEENMNKMDSDIQDRLDEIYEAGLQNTKNIKLLESIVSKLPPAIEEKVTKKDAEKEKAAFDEALKEIKLNLPIYEKAIKSTEVRCASSEAELLENKREFNGSIERIDQEIVKMRESIASTTEQLELYLSTHTFEEYSKKAESTEQAIHQRITDLHNNINPCALLEQDNDVSEHTEDLKTTPNAFLKYLFDMFHTEAKAVIEKQNGKIKYMEDLLDTLKKNLNTNIYNAAKKAVGQLQATGQIKQPVENANNTLPSLIGVLQETIAKKCELSELLTLNDLKANKADLENLQRFAGQTNEKLKYALTMLNEFMRILTSSTKESRAEKVGKLSSVAFQLDLLHKSVIADADVSAELSTSPHRYLGLENNTIDLDDHILPPTIQIKSSPKRVMRAKTRMDPLNFSDRRKTRMRKDTPQIQPKDQYYQTSAESCKASLNKSYASAASPKAHFGFKESNIAKHFSVHKQIKPACNFEMYCFN